MEGWAFPGLAIARGIAADFPDDDANQSTAEAALVVLVVNCQHYSFCDR